MRLSIPTFGLSRLRRGEVPRQAVGEHFMPIQLALGVQSPKKPAIYPTRLQLFAIVGADAVEVQAAGQSH